VLAVTDSAGSPEHVTCRGRSEASRLPTPSSGELPSPAILPRSAWPGRTILTTRRAVWLEEAGDGKKRAAPH
jgi:hypothetical protein